MFFQGLVVTTQRKAKMVFDHFPGGSEPETGVDPEEWNESGSSTETEIHRTELFWLDYQEDSGVITSFLVHKVNTCFFCLKVCHFACCFGLKFLLFFLSLLRRISLRRWWSVFQRRTSWMLQWEQLWRFEFERKLIKDETTGDGGQQTADLKDKAVKVTVLCSCFCVVWAQRGSCCHLQWHLAEVTWRQAMCWRKEKHLSLH